MSHANGYICHDTRMNVMTHIWDTNVSHIWMSWVCMCHCVQIIYMWGRANYLYVCERTHAHTYECTILLCLCVCACVMACKSLQVNRVQIIRMCHVTHAWMNHATHTYEYVISLTYACVTHSHAVPTRHFSRKPSISRECVALQHTATHCNTLQHTATHCNTLQHTVKRGNSLQLIYNSCTESRRYHVDASHCNTLQYTAIHCNTLPNAATRCNSSTTTHLLKAVDITRMRHLTHIHE